MRALDTFTTTADRSADRALSDRLHIAGTNTDSAMCLHLLVRIGATPYSIAGNARSHTISDIDEDEGNERGRIERNEWV
jgi:hypothetical protein